MRAIDCPCGHRFLADDEQIREPGAGDVVAA